MSKMQAFIDRQWNAHRATMTHIPTTARTTCQINGRPAHGGGWDRYTWTGDTQATERAVCDGCGQIIRGNMSPWAEAALADWYATPYMQRVFIETRNGIVARRIKLGRWRQQIAA